MFGRKVTTGSGEEVEIIEPGVHNRDAGPDFAAAHIRSGGEEWAGDVEIHVKASDWHRHGHDTDKAYDKVILHVVGIDDARIFRTDGTEILQACVAPPPEFYNRYAILTEKIDSPTCLGWLHNIPGLCKSDWVATLGIERLHEKAAYMKALLRQYQGDWQQTVFIVLARALGFGLNGVPFELLAKSLPLNYVMRHRDNPEQVEAMVFGQAGLLQPGEYEYDDFYTLLCREYSFLKTKYGLNPLSREIWKFARTRPHNFPHRRMAILAAMLCDGMQLHTRILEAAGDYESLMELLDFEASGYWRRHSRFGEGESQLTLPVALSKSSKEIILVNVMAPFYYAYGSLTADPDIAEKGMDLLETIAPERNSIVELWARHGLKATSAFDSQALIQLRKCYCDRSRCLECRWGHFLLRDSMT